VTVAAVGLMLDSGGNDSYSEIANAEAIAVADDRITTPGSDAIATAGAEPTYIYGEGYGGPGAAGFLLDGGGNDVYDMTATNTATATATAALDGTPLSASASPGSTSLFGEGSGVIGYGELSDGGGNDRYSTTSRAEASANPPTEVGEGTALGSSLAGSASGLALFVDQSSAPDTDTFEQIPAVPACQGTRGEDTWVDCGTAAYPGVAIGINR
jgi:hypothetical protein